MVWIGFARLCDGTVRSPLNGRSAIIEATNQPHFTVNLDVDVRAKREHECLLTFAVFQLWVSQEIVKDRNLVLV
jgi:hypothetical protein